MRKVYFNKMQREVTAIDAHTSVVVAGRGTGKGVLHAAINLRNFQQMPGSTTAFVAPSATRALTNTLPSMFQHWEAWGYRRGIHWLVGQKPPRRLGWPAPLIAPDKWDNIISFYTGAIGQVISQDRTGTSNSKSFDFVAVDEAKFINFERLKDETLPANRGQQREFGHLHFHHGLLVTSDMPVTRKGSWFLRYEKDHDAELIDTIRSLVAEEWAARRRIEAEGADASDYARRHLREVRDMLTTLRRRATLYATYSSLTNIEVLGEAWVRQMRRDLPPLVFRTSILCLPVDQVRDGFYSSMRPAHRYIAPASDFVLSRGFDLRPDDAPCCRADSDILPDFPLCIAFDFNANINWLVVGQPDESRRRMNTLKSFYVKYDRKLPELVGDFCDYYEPLPLHEVIVYYDSTALGSNYAVNDQDFLWVITHTLEARGWTVRPVYVGKPMAHLEKFLLINRGFAGQARLMPFFNEENNDALLLSIRSAGVYSGKKDKRGEKLAETEEDKLEGRTDGSDAWDTLYIGCERFPQQATLLRVTSGLD